MVRLRVSPEIHSVTTTRDFNSLMVRLREGGSTMLREKYLYFNSLMVRLREPILITADIIAPQFQFLNGAIESLVEKSLQYAPPNFNSLMVRLRDKFVNLRANF